MIGHLTHGIGTRSSQVRKTANSGKHAVFPDMTSREKLLRRMDGDIIGKL